MKFERGDVVRLKSGGPLMTVQNVQYEDAVECTWFDAKQQRQTDSFHEELLEEASDDPLEPLVMG